MMRRFFLFALLLILVYSCGKKHETEHAYNSELPDIYKAYWYCGKAEITGYKLEQARYGEIRNGSAVMVFVTEDFSQSRQVKLDNPSKNSKDAVSILKLNLTKNFVTGIYPYSMMLSVFKPFTIQNISHALKVTSTSQEWCGQTFWQLNSRENQYNVKLFSYFESESDQQKSLAVVWLEDELFSQIRINPNLLPEGNFQVLPGSMQQRFLRHAIKTYNGTGDNYEMYDSTYSKTENIGVYKLNVSEIDKELKIFYDLDFPHIILGWEEKYQDGSGANKKLLTTKAIRLESIINDYWNHNKNKDSLLRGHLKLN